jgi:protein AroM
MDVAIVLRGALDGLSREEIRRAAPHGAADTLFTVLPDGTSVKVSHAVVAQHARAALQEMQREGCQLVALCCTGEFPALEDLPVLFPSRIHTQVAVGIGCNRRLGVYVPLAEQQALARQRWLACGFGDVVTVALVPNATRAQIERAATQMDKAAPDLIVYDCMGYHSELRVGADAITRKPAILSVSLVARIMAELLNAEHRA